MAGGLKAHFSDSSVSDGSEGGEAYPFERWASLCEAISVVFPLLALESLAFEQ